MTEPLFVDVSSWQDATIRPEAWVRLAAMGAPWHGVVLKASEGTGGSAAWRVRMAAWFARHWPAVREAAGERWGVDFYRGAYHFLIVDGAASGRAQAEHHVRQIEALGGYGLGDLWPVVDVEEGSGNATRVAAAAGARGRMLVEETTEAYAARIRELTGRATVLYAGWWLASIGVRSRMGCELLWYASYTARLAAATYERIGWDVDSLFAWQYCGLGAGGVPIAHLAGYPRTTPVGHADINVLTLPGGLDRVRARLWAERPAPSSCATGPAR